MLQVLSEPSHTLQNKVIDPKRAQTRGAIEVCRKIFVGGLDPNLPEESIRDYFEKYGKVSSFSFFWLEKMTRMVEKFHAIALTAWQL